MVLIKIVIFSNESSFQIIEFVNKQNCQIWEEHNPQEIVENRRHSQKVPTLKAYTNSPNSSHTINDPK